MTARPPSAPDPRRGEARVMGEPQDGYWLLSLGRNCPMVPACIRTDENGEKHAFIIDEQVALDRVWHRRGKPISAADYAFAVADIQWCREWQRDDPRCKPSKPIDLTKLPPVEP